MKILIWGAGYNLNYVIDNLNLPYEIVAIVDSNTSIQGKLIFDKYTIISPTDILSMEYDLIVVSVVNDITIENQCTELGIPKQKVVFFWRETHEIIRNNKEYNIRRIETLEARLDSMPYELRIKPVPSILPGVDCLNEILLHKKSLCRFGDGEFEIMRGNNRAWFQCTNRKLQQRLMEVINCNQEDILIATAQNFYDLDKYEEESADIIRRYMKGQTRQEILGFLNLDREYYDAYLSRPYMIYKEKDNAIQIFDCFKRIVQNKDVLVAEGISGRMGLGNDMLNGAKSIRRIACPEKDAFEKYEEILETILKYSQNDELILLSLGPTATVLAYDLTMNGRQALDIGQIDNEYDWYNLKATTRVPIKGKMVAEIKESERYEYKFWEDYDRQLVATIA